jgi:hypothetical protein
MGHSVSTDTKIKISINTKAAFAEMGHIPWNKNLTKEDDSRLMSVSEKVREWNLYSMTDEKKRQISQTLKEKYRDGMQIPHAKDGYRDDLQHYFRSTWEANYARYLNFENIEWTYELYKFPFYDEDGRILSVYTPDFFTDKFVEIKGHADSNTLWTCDCRRCERDKNRMALFLSQYPDKDIIIVGREEYKALARKYANLIPNWEVTSRG